MRQCCGVARDHPDLLLSKESAYRRKLVAGPKFFICDDCVELCMVIVRGGSSQLYMRTRT